jgi:PPM family protein phosphatase
METEKITIYPPAYFSKIGERSNNEDAVYPDEASTSNRLFIVCDGVGGQHKGEVASALACKYFAEYIHQNELNTDSKGFFAKALVYAEEKMEDHINEHPECSKMATTLTLLFFPPDFRIAHLIWVGDSRIYHIRDKKILFQTKDHSEVQDLLDMGEISQEEARTHQRRNIITRAISGSSNPTRIDYKKIEEILPNDFFLLCTDGLLETLDKNKIENWFKKECSPQRIKKEILENAMGKTRDNYTMYLIKINNP